MAITRQVNWIGQQRVDLVDLRSVESAVSHDFDLAIGYVWGENQPWVVRGFTIDTTSVSGRSANDLQLNVEDGILLSSQATESGTLLEVPSGRTLEDLNSTNSLVTGTWQASGYNYVSIDYTRAPDSATADVTKFIASNTETERAQVVPKARTMDYRIVISSIPFSQTPNLIPIVRVTTDASLNVVAVTDCRPLLFRLGTGGDSPQPYESFQWSETRTENNSTYGYTSLLNPFDGGDKGILSLKSWMNAMMSVLWEAKSGEAWYSATTRDGVKMAYGSSPVFGNHDNFEWDLASSTISWTGMSMLFENSSGGFKNPIVDGTASLTDGQCLYVDLDRVGGGSITAAVADLEELGTPTIAGSRFIVAWRDGDDLHLRDRPFDFERLEAILNIAYRHYPNFFVSTVSGEGDYTTLSAAIAALPAAGGVIAVLSDLTITNTTITVPDNVTILARNGIEITMDGNSSKFVLGNRCVLRDLWLSEANKSGSVYMVEFTGTKNQIINCRFDVSGSTKAWDAATGDLLAAFGNEGVASSTIDATSYIEAEASSSALWIEAGAFGARGLFINAYGDALNVSSSSGYGAQVAGAVYGIYTYAQNAGGTGIVSFGSTTGSGGEFYSGTTGGYGIKCFGNGGNAIGVYGVGDGTGVGGYFEGQGDGTGSSDDAIHSAQNIHLAGDNPAATTGFTNRLTPANTVKAWARIAPGGGSPSIEAGFNCASVAYTGTGLYEVTMATPMANTDYIVVPTRNGINPTTWGILAYPVSTTVFAVLGWDLSGDAATSLPGEFGVMVLGLQ